MCVIYYKYVANYTSNIYEHTFICKGNESEMFSKIS